MTLLAIGFMFLFILAIAGWIVPRKKTERRPGWPLGLKIFLTVASGCLMSVTGCFVALSAINKQGGHPFVLLVAGLVVFAAGFLWWFVLGLWYLAQALGEGWRRANSRDM